MSAQTHFDGFSAETLSFLSELRENNTKAWFDENRSIYEGAVKKPARAFSEAIAGEVEKLTETPHKPKLFRINRDIRFSKDKTPYNSHIHMSWSAAEGGGSPPAFMFGVSPDYCSAGCGVFEFQKTTLEDYRQKIAGPFGDDLGRLLDDLKEAGYRLSDPSLKRLPAGFPEDHPCAELALRKGVVAWWDFASPQDATRPDIVALVMERFRQMLPLWRFLVRLR